MSRGDLVGGDAESLGDEYQRFDREPLGHQRGGEAAVGLADDDQVAAVADGVDMVVILE